MRKKPGASLSICLIVKNEAELLPECLASLSGLDAQLVVLDTGSTDNTREIAKAFGAEVHTFKWVNDFSAARNASIKYAKHDWILWLDADERLAKSSHRHLLKLLTKETKPVIYRVRIRNLKEDGVNFSLSDAHRLFTNHFGIKFSGAIHEQISPSASKLGVDERWSQIVLDHLGYSFTDERREQKQIRNLKLLQKEVHDNPRSAYAHYTLAHNLKTGGDLHKAKEHYGIALELKQLDDDMTASLLNSYADTLLDLSQTQGVETFIKRSIKLRPRQNAAYFLLYRYALALGDQETALKALETVKEIQLQISEKGSSISTDIEIANHFIEYTRGELLCRMGNVTEAITAFSESLKLGGDTLEGLKALFKIYEKQQAWSQAVEILGRLIKLQGEDPNLINALATILIRMKNFHAALDTLLHLKKIHPHMDGLDRKIAGMYAKLGNITEAQRWLGLPSNN